MYTTRNPAHQNRSPRIPSAGSESLCESPLDVGVCPEEFFNFRISLATVCPETALMYAVLEDAFLCLQKHLEMDASSIDQAREAHDWFFNDTSEGLFSFLSICTALGLKPEFVRKRLRDWRQPRLIHSC